MRKQYKERISDYRSWDQYDHAQDYILYPDNLGEDLSLDETCLSNGDVYTILTNKAAHGGKGSLVAMIKGVAADTVSDVLKKIPMRKRLMVKTVTTDLSSAMMLIGRKVFLKASLINDRFHVQQLIAEAVDQLRIRHRWEVLEAENKAIKEHRARRKAAKTKPKRELIGQWEPQRMKNGETMPQIMARSRLIILKHRSKWNEQQKARAEILFSVFPDLEKAYRLFLKLVEIFNKKDAPDVARLNLARWYNEVEAFGNNEFNKVLETFENHNTTIVNYFERRLTNASAESFNAKIKAFRSQFRGVGDIRFFMFRLATLYGRLVKDLCLGVYLAESEDEKFSVVDTVKFGSEGFDFGVYRLGRCVGRTVVKEVQDFLGVLVKGCGYGVERLEAGLGDTVVPTSEIKTGTVFGRVSVEYGSEVLRQPVCFLQIRI